MGKNKKNETAISLKQNNYMVMFIFLCFLAVAGFILILLRGFSGMEPSWTYSVGTEVFGMIICAIIFYSLFQNNSEIEIFKSYFGISIILCSISLFLDQCGWMALGQSEYAFVEKISNVILYINNYALILVFWYYSRDLLKLNSMLAKVCTNLFHLVLGLLIVFSFVNFFIPVFFEVDASGDYTRTKLYLSGSIVYIVILPAIVEGLIKSKASVKNKIVSSSFFLLPLLADILAVFWYGVSLKPAAILLAILLNYGITIANRDVEMAATKNGLDIASKIQVDLLPTKFPAFPDKTEFDIYASMTPALKVGGDFYDFFMIDDDHLAFLIADVSDKGIGAAVFMTISKTLIKTRAQMGGAPNEIVEYVDQSIAEKNQAGMFVTLWLGIIDLNTGHVEVCNAGHDYPAILKNGGDYTAEKTPHGPAIGFLPGIKYKTTEFDLEPGERVFLYTDGIPEAKSADSDRLGIEGMLEILNDSKDLTDEELVTKMRSAVNSFADGEPQFDDITMLSFTFKGRNSTPSAE